MRDQKAELRLDDATGDVVRLGCGETAPASGAVTHS